VFGSISIVPCDYHFVPDVLIDLAAIVKDRICDVGKKVFQQHVIAFVAQPFRYCCGSIQVEKHKDAILLLRDLVLAADAVGECSVAELIIDLVTKVRYPDHQGPGHDVLYARCVRKKNPERFLSGRSGKWSSSAKRNDHSTKNEDNEPDHSYISHSDCQNSLTVWLVPIFHVNIEYHHSST